MEAAERSRRAGFSLRLEQGLGRLRLSQRRIADLLEVDTLDLALREVPSRLDMSAGVERFRHQRARLEALRVHADDHDLGRAFRRWARDLPLLDLEVRAVDGDLVLLGEIEGEPGAPFVARVRLEPAGMTGERTLLVSVYEVRIFGPARLTAPQLGSVLLRGLGLSGQLVGPTAAVVDPVDRLLFEICAELGWKVPARDHARLLEVRAEAGRVSMVATHQTHGVVGPRGLGSVDSSARARRFLADYEAKTLFAATEALVAEGRLERAVAAYERQLEVHPEHPFLVTRLLQLLVARPETLGDALALARGRLDRFPDDPDALAALAVVQWRRDHLAAAAETLERIAAAAEARGDAVESAQARCAVAAVYARREPARAVAALEDALRLRRRLPGALRALADLHARTGDWAAALRARERLLAGESDPERRRALLGELGQLALEKADDVEAARGYFERALEVAPDDIDALVGLAGAQEATGRLLPAVRTLDRAAQLLQQRGDGGRAAAVLVRLGDLWRRVPEGGAHTAALRYRQALLLEPSNAGAVLGLAEAAADEGDPTRARGYFEEVLRLGAEGRAEVDRAEIALRLGRLLEGPLDDADLAVTWYQKALAGRAEQGARALAALERVHARAGRWDDLARVLEAALERAPDDATRGERLARLAAVLAEHLEAPGRAAELLREAAALRPADLDVLDRLAALERARDRHGALAEVLTEMAERCQDPERLAELYAERGDLLRRHLNRTDDAVEFYTLALGCDPRHRGALEGLADIYRERERFPELASLLGRLARVEDDARASGLAWLELGRLQASVLDRPEAAVDALERAVERLPEDTEALRRLADLHHGAGRAEAALHRYRQLHAIYERDGYDEPAPPFLVRLAVAWDALGDRAEALKALRAAVAQAPDGVAIYEQAQDVLLPTGDVEGIVDFLREGLERARQPATRVFLARRAGRLAWRELRRPEQAAELLDEALAHAPDDEDAARVRLEVATALADWPRVAELLRGRLRNAGATERPALLTQLAELAYTELDRADEGHQLAQAALEAQPDYVPALALLAEQAWSAADWSHARDALARLVELEGPRARVEDRVRRAVAELYVGDPAAARAACVKLREEGHEAPDLLPTLAEACLQLEDAEGLAAVWAERGAAFDDDPRRASFLRRAAHLFAERSEWTAEAETCWRALLEVDPDDEEAQAALTAPTSEAPEPESAPPASPPPEVETAPDASTADLDAAAADGIEGDEESGDHPEDEEDDELPPLIPTRAPPAAPAEALGDLEFRLSEAKSDGERAAAWMAIAEHRRDRMHDPDAAMTAFEQVLDEAPPGDHHWMEAMEALEDIYAVRGDWDPLLELYDRRLATGVGAPDEVHLLRASILRATQRIDAAIEAAEQALPAGPRAVEMLVALLIEAGRSAEAGDRLLADLDGLSAEDAAHRRWRAAELLEEAAPERALAELEAAFVLDPDPMLVEAWVELARRLDVPGSLAAALEARAATMQDEGVETIRASGLLLEAAQLRAGRLAQPDRARALLEESLSAWPDNIEALSAMAELLAAMNDHAALAEVLNRQVELSFAGAHRGELARRVAELHLHALADPDAARPFVEMAREDLGEVDVVRALEAALDPTPTAEDPAGRARALLVDPDPPEGALRALIEEVEDRAPLLAALEACVVDPEAPLGATARALRTLAGVRRRRVELDRLRRLLDDRVDGARLESERSALMALRGELWRSRLGHVERARADLEAAQALDPNNPVAAVGLGLLAADRGQNIDAAGLLARALLNTEQALIAPTAQVLREAKRRLGALLESEPEARAALTEEVEAARAAGRAAPDALREWLQS